MEETEKDRKEEETEQAESKKLASFLEAALFMASRALTIHELKKASMEIGNFSLTEIKTALEALRSKYAARESWIEIAEIGGKYLMRVAPQYTDSVAGLAQAAELSKTALRVLALAVKNEGLTQAQCVRAIGKSTYDGVKQLVEKGFLCAKPAGRTKKLWLTKKFKLYFGDLQSMVK